MINPILGVGLTLFLFGIIFLQIRVVVSQLARLFQEVENCSAVVDRVRSTRSLELPEVASSFVPCVLQKGNEYSSRVAARTPDNLLLVVDPLANTDLVVPLQAMKYQSAMRPFMLFRYTQFLVPDADYPGDPRKKLLLYFADGGASTLELD